MTVDDEVRRATKLLETIMQAGGLTRKDLDLRLGSGPGYVSQLFTGRMELKLRHVLAILHALEVEPGVFFQTLYPDGKPVGDKMLMDEFLKRYRKLKLGPAEAPTAAPPGAALAGKVDYAELHDLIQSAVRAALQAGPETSAEVPGPAPSRPDPVVKRP